MSRRLVTVIAMCVALLLVIGWRTFAPSDFSAPPGNAAPDASTAASASFDGSAPPVTEPGMTVARSDAAPRGPQRRARIVDENGAPVANAEVAFDVSEELCEAWQPQPFDFELRLAAAPRYTSATDGIVVLPTDTAVAFVIARAGDRFGHRVIAFDSRLFEVPLLTIALDRNLRIAVVGPRGELRPDVPVMVVFQHEQGLVGEGTDTRWLPRTDANGVTMLWHAQTLPFWNRADPALDLQAMVLGASPRPVHVRLADPVADSIVLECPDHGGVRVRAWSAPGIPNHAWEMPQIGETDALELPLEMLMPGASPASWCVFPVALGKSWFVGSLHFEQVGVAGPVQHAQEVLVDLTQVPRDWTAQLLRPDGQPCASQFIELGEGFRLSFETDAQGHGAFDYGGDSLSFYAPRLHAVARVSLPTQRDPTGPTDLGVIRLESQHVLATGRVIDAATGQPLRAMLRKRRLTEADDDWFWGEQAGAEGQFELYGEAQGRIELEAMLAGFTTTKLEIAVGTRDIVMAMLPARLLRATVLVDAAIAVDALDVRMRQGDEPKIWRTARIEQSRFHAVFELPPGEDLVLEIAGADDLPSLRSVPLSEWTRENGAFAATVDLRGVLANVLVTIRRADAGDDANGSLYVRPTGSTAPWVEMQLRGRLAFAAPKATTLDAIVRPDGGACVRATLRPGENTIEVPLPSSAQVELTGMPPGVARTAIAVQVYRLVRRDPLLGELVAAGLDTIDQGEVHDWPRTAADLERMAGEDLWAVFGAGPVRFELRSHGSYVAVPYVVAGNRRVPLLDAAVGIEITTPGAVVEATIRLDPEKVRAALR